MQPTLSAYERRLWVEVDRILYQNYLTPRTVTDFWLGDRDAVISHLRQMKDRVVRAIVIMEYVEVDDVLNRAIRKHLFPIRAKRRVPQRERTVAEMLDRLYPQQKLDIVRNFRQVPHNIVSHVMALNTVRNNFAHRFHLADIPKFRRLYKGKHDVFTKAGLEKFRTDMWEVHEYFDPSITKAALQLVRVQRQRRTASSNRRPQ